MKKRLDFVSASNQKYHQALKKFKQKVPRKVLNQKQSIIDNRMATIDLRNNRSKGKLDTNCPVIELEKAKHK